MSSMVTAPCGVWLHTWVSWGWCGAQLGSMAGTKGIKQLATGDLSKQEIASQSKQDGNCAAIGLQGGPVCGGCRGQALGLVQPPPDPQPHCMARDRVSTRAAAGRSRVCHLPARLENCHPAGAGQQLHPPLVLFLCPWRFFCACSVACSVCCAALWLTCCKRSPGSRQPP